MIDLYAVSTLYNVFPFVADKGNKLLLIAVGLKAVLLPHTLLWIPSVNFTFLSAKEMRLGLCVEMGFSSHSSLIACSICSRTIITIHLTFFPLVF